ncbi:MAG: GtrA family protein [Gammaproteobacteria bacterium]|nr:GtrA family protein [Gammaproteobacteria bacterium]MBU0828481.1 GtrA family protein [Gammaproteobacteria bacterium]MBU0890461.1 GtrA family protein [Gammaproteobacteria bacterium]
MTWRSPGNIPLPALQFIKFGLVGTAGFLVDAMVLTLLVKFWQWPAPVARGPSFLIALTFTWALNRSATFHSEHRASVKEWLRYASLMCVGAAINYGVFFVFHMCVESMRPHPWVGVAAGSITAMLVNYLSMRTLFTSPSIR